MPLRPGVYVVWVCHANNETLLEDHSLQHVFNDDSQDKQDDYPLEVFVHNVSGTDNGVRLETVFRERIDLLEVTDCFVEGFIICVLCLNVPVAAPHDENACIKQQQQKLDANAGN